jgi:hypothetical protein
MKTVNKETALIIVNMSKIGSEKLGFRLVYDSGWEDDGKYSYSRLVFQDIETELYYSLELSRTGSYYTDYYYCWEDWSDEVELTEVFKKEKVIVVYE